MSSWYFLHKRCETVDEFLEKLETYFVHENQHSPGSGIWLFRGQNNSGFSMLPKSMRNDFQVQFVEPTFKYVKNLLMTSERYPRFE